MKAHPLPNGNFESSHLETQPGSVEPILALGIDPRPPGAATVVGTHFWRLRVGDLRIVYVIDGEADLVVVLRVVRRSESTYRRIET